MDIMKNLLGKSQDIVKFGMWGPPGAGKTTYITMLQYADCNGWSIKPRGRETQNLYIQYSELLRDKREFVPPTIADKVWYLTFDFERPGGAFTNKNYRVILPEASGEYYEKPDGHPELLNEISRYQGIIWLVDPERIDNPSPGNRSYRAMIQEWLYRLYDLQGEGMLKQHMVFCLTKMDLPQYYEYFENPRDFCLDKLGRDVEKFIGDFCDVNKVNFFATSSIGFCSGASKKLSTRDPDDETKLIEASDPINIFSPFEWLFDQYK